MPSSSAIIQAEVLDFELSHLKIYTIGEMLEPMEGKVLLIQSFKILMAQGINSNWEESNEDSILLV